MSKVKTEDDEYCQKCGRKISIFRSTYVPLFGRVCENCWAKVLEKRRAESDD